MVSRKGGLDVALVQPISPNKLNVNVNVNISINENLINPRYTSPSSVLKQNLKKYLSNKQTNQSPQLLRPSYMNNKSPINIYGYKPHSLEKSPKTAVHSWNAAKSIGFYTRK